MTKIIIGEQDTVIKPPDPSETWHIRLV